MTVTKDTVFTVYVHVNKTTGMTYIGVTSLKPERRWNNGKGYRGNDKFNSDIIKYGWDGFDHLILAITKEKTTAGILEQKLIEKYQALGLSYNLQSGGYEGYTEADSTRKKLSESLSGSNNPFYGKHHSIETRKKLSESLSGSNSPNYGKHLSIETRKKISENHADFSGSNSPKSLKVKQIDKTTGKVLKIWNCIREAERETGIAHQSISACCKGKKYRSAGGFVWGYLN